MDKEQRMNHMILQREMGALNIPAKFQLVRNWAQQRTFDLSFINSLEESFDEWDELTDKQSEALDNIILRFRIDLDKYYYNFDDNEDD